MRDKTLVKRQELLEFIQEYQGKYHIPPTLQEMAAKIYGGEENAGNVSRLLVNPLIEEGFLWKPKQGVRTIMLCSPLPREVYYRKEEEKVK